MEYDRICLPIAYQQDKVLTNCLPVEQGIFMESVLKNNKKKLTKMVIDGFSLPEKSPVFIWDTELKNFGIKLNPTGKVFIVQSRVNGQSRRVKIGDYGVFTVDEARREAKRFLMDMSNGINPTEEKKIKGAQAVTIEEVAQDYIKDRTLKTSSIHDINKHLKGTFKAWKDKPITAITREMVLKLFRQRSEQSPAQANQAFRVLRALLNYAMEAYRPGNKPIIIENPVQIISGARIWNKIKPKNRRIPIEQVGQAWVMLENMQLDLVQTMAFRSMVDAVLFCLLTGARWGECQKLTWDSVNLESGVDKETGEILGQWHIKDPKNTIPITLPLSSQARVLLESKPRIKENNFVFCSEKSKTGYIGPGRFVTDQLTEALGVELSAHDLRRTFRSIAAHLNVELWRTKLLMNHKMGNDITIQAYTEKSDLEYLRPNIQTIGDWIEKQGKLEKNKIIDLNVAREA